MKFGVFSNGQRLANPALSYEHDLREIVTADRLGFDEVWISEHTGHHWLPHPVAAPELLICKASALTKRIRFGAAVRRIALYPPQMMAIEGATADHLTSGRYNFGFGVGPPLTNYEHWGIDPAEAGARTAEAIDLIQRCWDGSGPFDYDGQYYRGTGIDIFPRTLQKPIPVAVATGNERMLAVAAERRFRVLSTWSAPTEAIARIGRSFDAACEAGGGRARREDLTVCRAVYVAATDDEAIRDVADNFRTMLAYNSVHLEPASNQYKSASPARSVMTFESMLAAGNVIVGSPDTVAARIAAFHQDVGGFGTFLVVGGRDFATPDQIDGMYELFMTEVAPRLQALDSRIDTASKGANAAVA